jgi:hypothetical protein
VLHVEDVSLPVLRVRWQRYCSVQRRGDSERCSESNDIELLSLRSPLAAFISCIRLDLALFFCLFVFLSERLSPVKYPVSRTISSDVLRSQTPGPALVDTTKPRGRGSRSTTTRRRVLCALGASSVALSNTVAHSELVALVEAAHDYPTTCIQWQPASSNDERWTNKQMQQ